MTSGIDMNEIADALPRDVFNRLADDPSTSDQDWLDAYQANRTPRIERTHFEPQSPPAEVTLYFCPACGKRISGNYNLEPARKSCTKTWHLAMPVEQTYRAVDRAA